MQAILYSFEKRKNSTAVVSVSGSTVDLVLKAGTSVFKPTFELRTSGYLNYNYAYVADFGRYYFINEQRLGINNYMELDCECDVLATYKLNIVGASAYIRHRTKTNTQIIDTRLSMKTSATVASTTGAMPHIDSQVGTYVIGVQGVDSVNYYCTDNFSHITRLVGSNEFWNVINSLATVEDCLKQIASCNDIVSNIKSCFWIPFDVPREYAGGNVFLGGFDTGYALPVVSSRMELFGVVGGSIPWQASDWRRNAPFHQIYVYLPFVGLVPLSPNTIMDASSLNIQGAINYYSGDISYDITASNGRKLGTFGTNTACSMAIGASNISAKQVASAAIGVASSVILGAATGGAGAALGMGAMSAVNGVLSTDMQHGGIYVSGGGTGIAGGESIVIYSVFHDTNVDPHNLSAIAGEPEFSVMAIPSSGFVETIGFSVSGSMLDAERDAINSLCDRGIYVE